MFLQLPFYHFILLLIIIPLSSFSAVPLPEKGCEVKCGNLSIPFPFGLGPGCSLEPSFEIKCNTSTNSPKAYLSALNIEVIDINETYIRVIYPRLVSACYDLSDYQRGAGMSVTAESPYKRSSMSHHHVNLTGTPFTLSAINKLILIGCDDMVVAFDQPNGTSPMAGCSSVCYTDKNDAGGAVGYCSIDDTYNSPGNGCSNFPIHPGQRFLRAELIELGGQLGRRKFYPCSYAYIQEFEELDERLFSFPFYYLDNSTTMLNDHWASPPPPPPPVARLNWMIGEKNCTQAKAYACLLQKTYCVDSGDDVSITTGYRCSCIPDYEGNPYLPGGCKSINSGSISIAKLGCQDQCGKLSIPYPFGIGKNCYQEPSFNVRCNNSAIIPKAYLVALNAEIIEFTNSSQVLVDYPNLGFACYNLSHAKSEGSTLTIDLKRTQYTLSNENLITLVGCNAMMLGRFGPANRTFMGSSCAAVCSDQQPAYGFCPGHACCRAAIPNGTTYLEANLSDLISGQLHPTNVSCSYTYVEYKDSYTSGLPLVNNSTEVQLYDLKRYWWQRKVALDWRIGAVSCNEARLNPATFACRENTVCADFDATVGGYLCNCSKGYTGNPYLSPGCLDINECANHTTNPCYPNSKCNNTRGSFQCLCPKGYSGDGRKDGKGCIQQQQTELIIFIGMGSGLGFLLFLLTCFWFYKVFEKQKVKRVKKKFFKRNGGLLLRQQTNEGALGKTKVFPANELEVATDHFNASRILGQGGQGTVYKGMLSDGTIVAIKKSKLVEVNQLEQFINEVVILSQINHRNVVKLLGCCLETEVPLLVYEFMPNGTLFDLIHDPNNEFLFLWNSRLKIAADIAGALAYLHSASSIPIYHRDIKSSNILLDEKYVVKVSDFGTSRSVDADQTHVSTMVKGTFGYLDPEYFQSSQFTEKSDVYSFGVVLVELLTGQRPISLDKTDEDRGLATRFLLSMEENSIDTILDPKVLEQGRKEDVILVAKLAQRCLNLKGKMRPTMKQVATELESSRISQMSTIVEDEFEEFRDFEDTPTISNIDYT